MISVNMKSRNWMMAAEVLAVLGIRRQTLYANVSRGRIRAKPDPGDSRRSLYHAEDVRRLVAHRSGRPSSERIAAESISWGNPVLSSGISTVAHGRLWYRGVDAVKLAERGNLEEVASLLWHGSPIRVPSRPRGRASQWAALDVHEAMFALLASRAGRDPPISGRAFSSLHSEAADLFGDLSDAMISAINRPSSVRPKQSARQHISKRSAAAPVHERLAYAWKRPAAADAIRRALVLLADHELNTSTFAARVAASTGASLSASVLAGFATLSGPLHGGTAHALQELVEIASHAGAENAILGCLARGQAVPAFGHPLYPDGDVRACALLQHMNLPPIFEDLRVHAERLIGELPNVDFALAALAASAGLPRDAPFILFAIARSVGWIGHSLEQS